MCEAIGLLPDKLQQITVHLAGIAVDAKEPEAARELIRFLYSSDAVALYKTKGLGLGF